MKVAKCNAGHYYDIEKHLSCPHCSKNNQKVEQSTEGTMIKCAKGHWYDSSQYASCPSCKQESNSRKQQSMDFICHKAKCVSMSFGESRHVKYIDFDIEKGILLYYNRISPTLGGQHFPDHYFDEKVLELDAEQIKLCKKCLDENLKKLPFERPITETFLPPGCNGGSRLHYVDKSGNSLVYKNVHYNEGDRFVNHEPLKEEFLKIFYFFESFCEFPKYMPETIIDENDTPDKLIANDERYFEETLWTCKKCQTGNLLENSYCINCGEYRGW